MYKKIIISSILGLSLTVVILGISLREPAPIYSAAIPEEAITPQELKEEIKEKDLKISAIKAIQIAEKESSGQAIALRLRRLRNGKLGYAVVVLGKPPISLEIVIVHGTTGAVILSSGMESYSIAVPTGRLM